LFYIYLSFDWGCLFPVSVFTGKGGVGDEHVRERWMNVIDISFP
jgi:hypothetical protein